MAAVSRACSAGLNAHAQARLLTPAESTIAEFLEARPGDSLLVRAGDVLLDFSPPIAFALVERALGGQRLTRPPSRPLRPLEAEILSPVAAAILESLLPPAGDVRWASASALAGQPWPEGPFVLLSVEILSEGVLGDVVIAAPAARFEPEAARPAAPEIPAAPGVGIEIAARFPLGRIRLGDVRSLAPGDLLSWGGDPAPELTIEVSGKARFKARPGSLGGKLAAEILKESGAEAAPSKIVLTPGGGTSTGVPDVPVEARAVLAERPISLRDLGALRPGALLEFPTGIPGTVELRLGRRTVARGRAVRAGDRLAVQIQPSVDSGRKPR
jgi:flagellar motor switch/type III secretory pathway protein FliN